MVEGETLGGLKTVSNYVCWRKCKEWFWNSKSGGVWGQGLEVGGGWGRGGS